MTYKIPCPITEFNGLLVLRPAGNPINHSTS